MQELKKMSEIRFNLEALILLAKLQQKMNNSDEALMTFIEADNLAQGTKPEVKHSIGILYFQRKNYLKASNFLGEAVNYDTANLDYKFHLVNF
jgi:tetratricopeptide (TPR) repeat protein